MDERSRISIGPVLFHWAAEEKRDFWYRIADEAAVEIAYLGEVICSKRTPFFVHHLADVAERLQRGGKTVVWSTLSQVITKLDRQIVADICSMDGIEVEANDVSALFHLAGHPHRIGQYVNTYNERTLGRLCAGGAMHFTLPAELPAPSIAGLAEAARKENAGIEIQVFGRVSLALSARCYHARAHGRTKDNCLFVCEQDADGMPLSTRTGEPFLSINGIQTLSHGFLNLSAEMPALRSMGVGTFRLSPHTCDMVRVAQAYRDQLDGRTSPADTDEALEAAGMPDPTMNGFFHRKPGMLNVAGA